MGDLEISENLMGKLWSSCYNIKLPDKINPVCVQFKNSFVTSG